MKIAQRGSYSRRTLLAGLSAAVAAPALGANPQTRLVPRPPLYSHPHAALSHFAARTVRAGHAHGVSVAAVMRDEKILTGVAGWANPDARLPMRPATRMMTGSTGKTFCAAVAMSLAEDGALPLDAPLAPLFRNELWYRRLPHATGLTVRHLLMHAAGFPQFLDLAAFQASYFWDKVRGRDTGYSPRRMLEFVLDMEPLSPLGKAHNYSDLHYHLVGLAIEKVTGRSYYEALQERVLSKLGTSDIIPATSRHIPRLAAGYARGDIIAALIGGTGKTTDDQGQLRTTPKLEYTGGGLAATPRALALFFHRLANGHIVSARSFSEMISSSLKLPSTGNPVHYGLGLFVTSRPELGRYVSHSGFFPGYNTNAGYFLDHGFAAAFQVNSDHGPEIFQALRDTAKVVLAG